MRRGRSNLAVRFEDTLQPDGEESGGRMRGRNRRAAEQD